MRARGFILQPTYRIEAGRPVVHLYGRLESGQAFLVRDTSRTPHFFVRERDAAAARILGAAPCAPTEKTTFAGERVVRVDVTIPADVPPLRDRLQSARIPCYEADVRFALRPLIERGIRGSVTIEGEPREVRPRDGALTPRISPDSHPHSTSTSAPASLLVFDDPRLSPADWSPALTVLSFDIETDPTARQLLSISLYGSGASEVLLLTRSGQSAPAPAIPFRTERDLLLAFAARVKALDPDVLTGWNVIDFDLLVLLRIAERNRVLLEIGRGAGPVRIQSARSMWGASQAFVPGRTVLEGINLLRGAFIKLDEYSLDAVSREILGEGKTLHGHDRAAEILRTFEEDRPRFVEYNLTDSRLALQIVEKLRLVELAVERSRLTGMPPDRVSASIASFDFLYLSELARRGVVAPSVRAVAPLLPLGSPSGGSSVGEEPGSMRDGEIPLESEDPDAPLLSGLEDSERPGPFVPGGAAARGDRAIAVDADEEAGSEGTLGGYVMEPEPGLYRNVLVFDFKSLYPSLIRTFQIDPLGYVADATLAPDDPIVAPNGAAFRREPGILPRLLDHLVPLRDEAKRTGDDVKANAIKILMNSCYGVLGTPACRFHNPQIANAITAFGRERLLWSKSRIEQYGSRVLYGDTDSLFVLPGLEDPSDARKFGERLARLVNDDLAADIQERWRVDSRLELRFEALYLKLLLPHLRGGTSGARKRYAGLIASDGGSRLVFTGLEVMRRDWTDLAKQVQRDLYERLFADLPVEGYLQEVVAKLREGALDERLVYRKALRKGLDDYTKNTPPHVAAARKMSGRPGRLISYVITTAGPEPADEVHAPIDHEHYVQKQIRPVAEPILDILALDFDRIIGDATQLTLF